MRHSPIIFLLLVCCTTRDIVHDASSSGAEDTGESLETGINPDPDFFADGCAALLSCECPRHRYDSVETCQLLGAAGMVGAETEAVLLGLHLDKECYRDLVYFDNDLRFGCMSHQEYQRTHPNDLWYPDLDSCGACSPGYGERQLGETCSYYHNALSDCAPGLRCQGSICRNPCIVVGVPCVDWFDSVCQSGYDKDSNWDHRFICDESTKRCTGGTAGEPCINPDASGSADFCGGENWEMECVDGLCQVVPRPEQGQRCNFGRPCAEGLTCVNHDGLDATCEVLAGAGESCSNDGMCGDLLLCDNGVCVAGPAAGESCLSGKCGAYTHCEDNICIPTPPAVCGG